MPKRGRPRALDEIKQREICALVSTGCGIEAAARYVGCTARTIRRETRRNEKFQEDLRQAELKSRLSPLQTMQKAAATHWRAAAWMLERTDPERFARPNPKLLKPLDVEAMMSQLIEIVAQEIPDSPMRERVFGRLMAESRKAMREAVAADRL